MTVCTVRRIAVLVWISLVIALRGTAQDYPVSATLFITPPYSVYLPDYVTPGSEQLKLNLLLRDLNEPNYEVRLHFILEGAGIRIETNPSLTPPPIILSGGAPEMLGTDELAWYLSSKNLLFNGISRATYEQQASLPEGFYKFSFRVLDYRRPERQLSREAYTNAWFVLNDPPRINTPRCGTTIPLTDPQTILFQWMPMNTGSANSVLTTEYEITMVEVRPATRNPNDAMNTSSPIYKTTTQETSLLYGLTETPLIPGQTYAFRIQARDMNGRDMFKNGGFSEVCTFQYGEELPLPIPEQLSARPETERRAKVTWYMNLDADKFRVEYRKKVTEGQEAQWFNQESIEDNITLVDLTPETNYEVRVATVYRGVMSQYTNPVSFKTPPPRVYACGDAAHAEPPANKKPLITAVAGQYWKVGQFEMQVMEVRGGDGSFTGIGAVVIPYLGFRVYSTFKDLKVNEDREVFAGEVVALSEGAEAFKDRWEQEHPQPEEEAPQDSAATPPATPVPVEVTFPGTIDSVYANPDDGSIVIVGEDGTQTTVQQPVDEATGEKQPVSITDSAGNSYTVDKDGNVSGGGAPGGGTGGNNNVPATPVPADVDILKKLVKELLQEFKTEVNR